MASGEDRREVRAVVRFRMLEELRNEKLTPQERRDLFDRLHHEGLEIETGVVVRVSRATLYRYQKAFNAGGFQALLPKQRSDAGACRALSKRLVERAVALRHTAKERETRLLIKRLEQIFRSYRGKIKASTLDRHLAAAGASRRQLGVVHLKVFTRFEAAAPNAMWDGDVMHGALGLRVVVPGRSGAHRVYLVSWIDDHSRFLPHSEWYLEERLPCLEDCFKKGVLAHGLPDSSYTDLGAIYVAKIWLRALAELEVKRIKTRPRAKEAHGKIEKFHQSARTFEREAIAAGIHTLTELNEAWWAFIDLMIHDRVHDETHEQPALRYARLVNRRYPDPHKLSRLFLVRADRKVNVKFATVPVRGVDFRVDPLLRGRTVEVRFDPYALDRVYIWYGGRERQVALPACAANLPKPPEPLPDEISVAQQGDSRAFLRGLVDEAHEKRRRALPGLTLASIADTSSVPYCWSTFCDHLAATLGRAFEEFTEAERATAHDLWRGHGPLNRQWVQAALAKAVAAKGLRQHLAYYLDQIKVIHLADSEPEPATAAPARPLPHRTKGAPDHA